jgi:hypothetical protein
VLHHFTRSDGAYPDGYLRLKEDTFAPAVAQSMNAEQVQIVEVSPNPTTTDFAVKINSPSEKYASVTISDMNGIVVYEGEVNINEALRVGESLGRGIYILKARQGDHISIHRIVKK